MAKYQKNPFASSGKSSKKRRKQQKRNRMIVRWAGLLVCAGGLVFGAWKLMQMMDEIKVEGVFASQPAATAVPDPTATPEPTPEPKPVVTLAPEQINSNYALLVRAKTGEVIWNKGNSSDKVWPASITKVLSALVALEHIEDLNQTFAMPLNIYQPLFDQNASMAGFWSGESPTMQDLLYGTILPSGAEAVTALAIATAGDEATFIQWMNDKAAALGMKNSHFANVWGIYQEDHYSTPEDLAALMQAALQNETLKKIMSTAQYTTAPLAAHAEGVTMEHSVLKNPLTMQAEGFVLEGGKTGFTDEAGLCLASFAEKGGEEFVLVTTGAMLAPDQAKTESLHVQDAITIYSAIQMP